MATQLLIYAQATPISKQRHAEWSVKSGTDCSFAREVNSVPLLAVEIPAASEQYAVIFAGTEDNVMPAVMLGVRDKENLFLTEDGGWDARYVPAFIRRYPFVFSSADNGERFTLCIDEEFSGCNRKGVGERLFDAEGEQTQYLKNVLEFLQAYQVQFKRTELFCRRLVELGLLEPMQAQFRMRSGEMVSLTGFWAVSRDKLKALSDEQLGQLTRTDELELIHLHLASMRNVAALGNRMGPLAALEGTPGADEAGPPTAPELGEPEKGEPAAAVAKDG